MAEGIATRSSRGHRTICLPISEEAYPQIVDDPPRSGARSTSASGRRPSCSRRTSRAATN